MYLLKVGIKVGFTVGRNVTPGMENLIQCIKNNNEIVLYLPNVGIKVGINVGITVGRNEAIPRMYNCYYVL